MTRRRPGPAGRLLWLALLPVLLSGPSGLAAEGPAPRAALAVFITAEENVVLGLEPDEIRTLAAGAVTEALQASGAQVVGPDRVLPLLAKFRVRTGLMMDHDFLAETAARLDVQAVVVVDVLLQAGGWLVLGRSIDPVTGRVVGVAMAEAAEAAEDGSAPAPAGSGAPSLARACADVGRGLDLIAVPRGETLVSLPAETQGADPTVRLMVTMGLLRAVLADSVAGLTDPSLAATRLQGLGLDYDLLDEGSRGFLLAELGSASLLRCEVLSYRDAGLPARSRVNEDFEEEESSVIESAQLSLQLVDLTTGHVTVETSRYFEKRMETGWFGLPDRRTTLTQLEALFRDLWRAFVKEWKDS